MKEIVLDTETTGISVKRTQNCWDWMYWAWKFNTKKKKISLLFESWRKVSDKAFEVHGYTDEFLSNKKFIKISEEFLVLFIKKTDYS